MARIPSKSEILDWIADNPGLSAKRDIAKAFGIKGAERIELKRLLKELEGEGTLERRRKTYRDPEKLPPVTILTILPPDRNGDQFARPMEWQGEAPEPRVLFQPRKADAPVAEGDRILARVNEVKGEDHQYEARLIRKIGTNPHKILGIFRKGTEGGRIVPIDKGADKEWTVAAERTQGAKDGELVEAELAGPKGRMGLPRARIVERLGDPSAPKAVSLIAIHQHGIPDDFPDAVIEEADRMKPAPLGEPRGPARICRSSPSTRPMPATTTTPATPMPTRIRRTTAAISSGSPSPMSPITSRPARRWTARRGTGAIRPISPTASCRCCPTGCRATSARCTKASPVPVIAVRMKLDAKGRKIVAPFHAGDDQVGRQPQLRRGAGGAGRPPERPLRRLLDEVIAPLYAAYEATKTARAMRQPLDLDLPERKIELTEDGRVKSVAFRERLDAHRLIEEFMILANVAAAEELIRLRRPLLFRVHEEPSPEKLDALREVAVASGFTLAKGQVLRTEHLNRLLAQAEGTDFDELLNITTLRSMTQAYYTPENFGHFGLALRSYAHFTSPIRRYSDLIVHRALILGHGWGEDGLSPQDIEMLEETAQHISDTERRSMAAERDTTDRYLAAYLADRVGSEFAGRISGVTRFGLFVKLDETGADGLIPIRSVGRRVLPLRPEGPDADGRRYRL